MFHETDFRADKYVDEQRCSVKALPVLAYTRLCGPCAITSNPLPPPQPLRNNCIMQQPCTGSNAFFLTQFFFHRMLFSWLQDEYGGYRT